MHFKYYILLFIIFFTSIFLNAQNKIEKNKIDLKNNNLENLIVAKVGNIEISAKEFYLGYEFGPVFVKREKDSKKKYLNYLINEKLLANEGYGLNFEKDEELNLILNDITGDLASEQYYRSFIWNKIKLKDKDVELAQKKYNINLQIKWIFRKTQNEIVNDYLKTNSGNSFDSIFYKQLNDSIKLEDRSLNTTRLKLEKNNFPLSTIIDSLKKGETSKPIKTNDGWYIIKLEDFFVNPVVTETEFYTQQQEVKDFLTKLKADSASDYYVKNLLISSSPVIKRNIYNILRSAFIQKYYDVNKAALWYKDSLLNITYKDLDKYKNENLVTCKKKNYSIQNFLNWFKTRDPYIKFDFSNRIAFENKFQDLIWEMVKDNLIVENAYKHNFQKDKDVITEKNWWKDKLVFSKMKLKIAADINMSNNNIHNFYENNKEKYKDNKGNIISFENAKTNVTNDYYNQFYTRNLFLELNRLKKKYTVKINNDVLDKIKVSEEYDPNAIELYTVKKDGTFPHVIYPAIDKEWQFFE